jgi:hypothetical protein
MAVHVRKAVLDVSERSILGARASSYMWWQATHGTMS